MEQLWHFLNRTAATNTTQRTFQNCLYETSFIKENSTSNSAPQNQTSSGTIYNTIDKNEDNGLAYDVLRREKSTGTKNIINH